jgi:hypothetical protein
MSLENVDDEIILRASYIPKPTKDILFFDSACSLRHIFFWQSYIARSASGEYLILRRTQPRHPVTITKTRPMPGLVVLETHIWR